MKGQISIDLIFTILLAIVIIGALTTSMLAINDSQEKVILKRNLNTTALDISTTVLSTMALKDANFKVEITLPLLSYKQKTGYPIVVLDNNNIIVSEKLTGENINALEIAQNSSAVTISQVSSKVIIENA